MLDNISICKNCFNAEELCDCDNSSIVKVSFCDAGGETSELANKLLGVLEGDEQHNFIKDLQNKTTENFFWRKKQNQIMLLHLQFKYDCIPHNRKYNVPEKAKIFHSTGKYPWLHWTPLYSAN